MQIPTINRLVVLLGLMMIWGCSPAYIITTEPPKAQIFSGDKSLGETPLELAQSDISDQTGNGVLVRVEKEGYKSVWVWLPAEAMTYRFNLNLTPFYLRGDRNELAIVEEETSRLDLYRVTHNLLGLQTKLLFGDLEGLDNLEKINKANPTLGSAYFLNAVKALRENKNDEAMVLLQEAMRFAPEEPDFLDLFNEMRSKVADNQQ